MCKDHRIKSSHHPSWVIIRWTRSKLMKSCSGASVLFNYITSLLSSLHPLFKRQGSNLARGVVQGYFWTINRPRTSFLETRILARQSKKWMQVWSKVRKRGYQGQDHFLSQLQKVAKNKLSPALMSTWRQTRLWSSQILISQVVSLALANHLTLKSSASSNSPSRRETDFLTIVAPTLNMLNNNLHLLSPSRNQMTLIHRFKIREIQCKTRNCWMTSGRGLCRVLQLKVMMEEAISVQISLAC